MMTSYELLEARSKANLLLRLRDDLDAIEFLPVAERMPARTEALRVARIEYGSTWDEDGVMDALDDADDEWKEPNVDETNLIKARAKLVTVGAS